MAEGQWGISGALLPAGSTYRGSSRWTEKTEDSAAAGAAFKQRAGRRVEIRLPRRGEGVELVENGSSTAAQQLSPTVRRSGRELAALDELARLLGLSGPPARIEAYDISNIGAGHHRGRYGGL